MRQSNLSLQNMQNENLLVLFNQSNGSAINVPKIGFSSNQWDFQDEIVLY